MPGTPYTQFTTGIVFYGCDNPAHDDIAKLLAEERGHFVLLGGSSNP